MLAEYGFGYSSNYFDDDSPYLHRIDGKLTDIVEFPFAWVLDDAPFFQYSITLPGRTMQAPSAVFEAWRREFDVLYREDRYFCLAMHPQIIGRPSRITLLEELIKYILGHSRVWATRCDQVADALRPALRAKRAAEAGPSRPKVRARSAISSSASGCSAMIVSPVMPRVGPRAVALADPRRPARPGALVAELVGHGVDRLVLAPRQVQLLDALGGVAVAAADHHVLVEVLVAMAHAADVERDARLHARQRAAHVVGDGDPTRGLDLEVASSDLPPPARAEALLEPGPEHLHAAAARSPAAASRRRPPR